MNKDTYAIFQVEDCSATRNHLFAALDFLKQNCLAVSQENYDHMYTGPLENAPAADTQILKWLLAKFNLDRPEDFRGRSMSVSDVVVLQRDGNLTAYYVDAHGFVEKPEFLTGKYLYYSIQRPVDIGTFPKFGREPLAIENFDSRTEVDGGVARAWGVLTYTVPLTPRQQDDYDLRAAASNPDFSRPAPRQLAAQLEMIGKLEEQYNIPEGRRMTRLHADSGVFAKYERFTDEQVTERFREILEAKARPVERRAAPKRIARQLAEAKREAERGPDAPPKKQNKSREDR